MAGDSRATEAGSEEALLGQVAGEFSEQLARGETPSIDDYLARYPQIAELIRDLFPVLSALHEPRPQRAPDDGAPAVDWTELQHRQRLGDFVIEREIGRGGMGIVYEATQLSMGRRVAIKILPFAALTDSRRLRRFQNEIRAAATLNHPNIVSIYSVGEERGVHYYAMQYVSGQSLAKVIGDLRHKLQMREASGEEPSVTLAPPSPASENALLGAPSASPSVHSPRPTPPLAPQSTWLGSREGTATKSPAAAGSAFGSESDDVFTTDYFRSIARLMADVADGLAHAHQLGIVHRDIKPANLLLSSQGTISLTDFGVAQVGAEQNLSVAAELVGTLRYMAPEQALGRGVTDHRADLYSWGATLYELLTLRPIFSGNDRRELLRRIAWEEPVSPRKLNPRVPRDLQTIVLKTLAKDPSDRYSTAEELRRDLGRYLDNRPIKARMAGPLTRCKKLIQRHPWASALLVATSLIFSLLTATAAHRADQALLRAQDLLYAAGVRTAASAVNMGETYRAAEILEAYRPEPGDTSRRDFAWNYLQEQVDGRELVLDTARWGEPLCLALSPDGEQLVSAHASGTLLVWSTRSWERLVELRHPGGSEVGELSFRPDGQMLCSGDREGDVCIWDTRNYTRFAEYQCPSDQLADVAWTADGNWLLMAHARSITAWTAEPLGREWTWEAHASPITSVACSPDGQWVASGDEAGVLRTWDIARRSKLGDHPGRFPRITRLAWLNDSRRLLLGTQDGLTYLWEEASRRVLREFPGHQGSIYEIRVAAEGSRVLTASKDMTVRAWNPDDPQEKALIYQHARRAYDGHFLSDGRIVSCSRDGTIRVWPQVRNHFRKEALTAQPAGKAAAMSADGRWIFACSPAGLKSVASATHGSGQLIPVLAPANATVFLPRSSRCLFTTDDLAAEGEVLRHSTRNAAMIDFDADGDLDLIASFGATSASIWQERRADGSLKRPRLTRDSVKDTATVLLPSSDRDMAERWSVSALAGRFDRIRGTELVCQAEALPRPRALAVGDLDNDARPDLVLATEGDASLRWYANPESQELPAGVSVYQKEGVASDVLVADVDDDGWQDVVHMTSHGVGWSRNLGDGVFGPPNLVNPWQTDWGRLAWVDCDEDGIEDLVVGTLDSVVWYPRLGPATFDAARTLEELRDTDWLPRLASSTVVWNPRTREVEKHFQGFSSDVTALAVTRDEQMLAAGSRDGVVHVWRLNRGEPIWTVPQKFHTIDCLEWSNDGRYLMISAHDHVHVWDMILKRSRYLWDAHENTVASIVVSNQGDQVATISLDSTIRIWSLRTGKMEASLLGHKQRPIDGSFSPDDRLLATLGERGNVRLWHLSTNQTLLVLTDWSIPQAQQVTFTGPNTLMAVGNRHGTLERAIWQVEEDDSRR
jgi:serine/threonine protein kinase/WD40 repeat protein